MIEIWKDIEGYEGKYQVSNYGRVKSLNYRNTKKEKIMKNSKNTHGYYTVALSKNGETEHPKIHRLVASAFIPNPDNKPEVDHLDTNKANNRADNLQWSTHKENVGNPITKKHYSECRQGENNPFYGKRHSEEARKKQSEARQGKYVGENHPMYGKHRSEETKEKISEAKRGKKATEETRKKLSEARQGENNSNANLVICIFPSGETTKPMCITNLAKELGISKPTIRKILNSKEPYKVSKMANSNLEHLKSLEGIIIVSYQHHKTN